MAKRAHLRWTFPGRWLWLAGLAVLLNAAVAIQVLGRPVRAPTAPVHDTAPVDAGEGDTDAPKDPEFASQVAQIGRLPGALPTLRGMTTEPEVAATPEVVAPPFVPPPEMPEPEPVSEPTWLVRAIEDPIIGAPVERPVPPEALAVIDDMCSELVQLAEDVEQRGMQMERMELANGRMTTLSLQLDALEKSLVTDDQAAPDLGGAARDRLRPAIVRLMTALETTQHADTAEAPEGTTGEIADQTPVESVE